MLQKRLIDVHGATVKELRAYIANEGKRLNQQLVEIQKRGLTETSFGYEALANSSKNRDFLGVSKSGRLKVNLNTRGMERGELQRLAKLIDRTTAYQTITVTGIKEYYGRVFAKLREKYPGLAQFSDKQLEDILKTEGWESAKASVGSSQAFEMIGSADNADKIMAFLESSGAGKSIESYVKDFNEFTGARYVWQPAEEIPFTSKT